MNVTEYLPLYTDIPPLSHSTMLHILEARVRTAKGFFDVEMGNGTHELSLQITTKPGQDMARLLLMRGIEEVLESFHSLDITHVREELIDSFNFIFALLAMEELDYLSDVVAKKCSRVMTGPWSDDQVNLHVFVGCMHPFLEKLRNRSWQQSVQSPYFDGVPETIEMLTSIFRHLLNSIGGWEQFYPLFYAKDDVLQFRLRSNY